MLTEKQDNMIDETKLDKFESIAFIQCLKEELERHKQAHHYSLWLAYLWHHIPVKEKFYTLGAIRHLQDIEMIEKSIFYLMKKWNLA